MTKILLVEDDKFVSQAYREGLEEEKFKVSLAQNGIEGLEKLKKEKPDLILLDIVMPNKDGFGFLEDLKENKEYKQYKNIPVIVLSNLGEEENIEKAKKLGVLDYLIKTNHSMHEVVNRINFHLENQNGE